MRQSRVKRYARRLDCDRSFHPKHGSNKSVIELKLDEFEAMRLVDFEDLNQIDAADEMHVSRATVQRLLQSGRKKVVTALLYNHPLIVKNDIQNIRLKGEHKMNIAGKETKVIAMPTSDRNTIDEHFGHAKEFAIYTVVEDKVKEVQFALPPEHKPGAFPRFLHEKGVDVVITSGVGQRASQLFYHEGIDVILGASGNLEQNLHEYLQGILTSQGESCNHHEHHHDHHE
jgi:predicted DNA-binding protein (UPF0251 family)/predicted Fe-Mo cluster-binding NifX family protein